MGACLAFTQRVKACLAALGSLGPGVKGETWKPINVIAVACLKGFADLTKEYGEIVTLRDTEDINDQS